MKKAQASGESQSLDPLKKALKEGANLKVEKTHHKILENNLSFLSNFSTIFLNTKPEKVQTE